MCAAVRGDVFDWREEIAVDGVFWLPSDPAKRVFGNLKAQGGYWPILNTMQRLLHADQAAVVLGESGGHPISLLSCGIFLQSTTTQRIGCEAVVFGVHLDNHNVGNFCTLQYTNLHGLIPSETWKQIPSEVETSDVMHFEFDIDHDIAHITHDDLTIDIQIKASPGIRWSADSPPSFSVSPIVNVTLSSKSDFTIRTLKEVAGDLGLLWSLLSGEVSDIVAASCGRLGASAEATDADRPASIYSLIWDAAKPGNDQQCFGDVLYDLTAGDYANQLSSVVSAWLARRHVLRTATKLTVDSWKHGVSREARLGALAQALEAFHRASSHRQKFVDDEEYAKIEAVLAQTIGNAVVDKELKAALRKRVEFGNQVSLRRRTKDLFREMPNSVRDAFGKWQTIVDWMTETRNQMIHRDPEAAPMPFRDLVRVSALLSLTLHVSLLRMLGVPDEAISLRILMQARYQELIRYHNRSAE
jgi:hypothetical protein